MPERFTWWLIRRRRWVVSLTALAVVASVPLLLGINDRLTFEAFTDPGSESHAADAVLEAGFEVGAPNFVLLVTATSGTVDDAEVVDAVARLEADLVATGEVADVTSYWGTGDPSLRADDSTRGLLVARIAGSDDAVNDWVGANVETLVGERGPIEVAASGEAFFYREVGEGSVEDFERAEMVTIPVILVALLVVFGSVVAGLLPLLVAIIAVVGTAVFLVVMTTFTEISNFALTLTSALGLGLGVDYSLFVVNRFREEMAAGMASDLAVVRTVQTAGRTVLFSALAVMISLSSLVLIPLRFIQAIGVAAIVTALMALVGSVVVLPALLAVLGPRVNALTVWRRSTEAGAGEGFWFHSARFVMRHPLGVAASLTGMLLLVAVPALHLELGLPDDRVFPRGAEIRETGDVLREEFSSLAASPLLVVVPGADPVADAAEVDRLASTIATRPGVGTVTGPTGVHTAGTRTDLPPAVTDRFGSEAGIYLAVTTGVPPMSTESAALIDAIRSTPHSFSDVLVTGEAATALDVTRTMTGSFGLVLAFIAVATFVILFLQFGSVLVPLKAILLNILSIGALMGALVWVFQDGHGADLLGFTAVGSLYINIPILIFALAFGLSMDYEVFLLSRIKEEYDRTGDNDGAVASGLDRCGRIVSAAAILIALVFLTVGAFSTLRMMKAFGLGLAGVVLLDAFVIRGTLVPALMKLAGAANWWAPAPLRRLHDRFGFSEVVHLDGAEPAPKRRPRPLVAAGRERTGSGQ